MAQGRKLDLNHGQTLGLAGRLFMEWRRVFKVKVDPLRMILLGALITPSVTALEESEKVSSDHQSVQIITSSQTGGLRLNSTGTIPFKASRQPTESELSIIVNPQRRGQKILGIGSAITDASAEVFGKLSSERQEAFLEAVYGKGGIASSLIRTTIHSSDFSRESYTYVQDGDATLDTFTIKHDMAHRIPMIQRAMKKTGGEIHLYASPWSPPAFMKSNGKMTNGGSLLPEYKEAWAQYFVKFIQAYEKEGLSIWGITVQNEPMAVQRWESCIYTAEQERDFLRDHLGPTLAKAGLGDKKIIVWDHNRDLIVHRADTILSDPNAAKYVWGIGFHWYETWTGSEPNFTNIAMVNKAFPNVNLVFTEGCNEKFDREQLDSWKLAERYGRSMIEDFNRGVVAWTDWNVLLDENGGPNHVGNFCFAPIHADTKADRLIFTPSYYVFGHFSKYIRPGATHIATSTTQTGVIATSFQNPNGGFVTIAMNREDKSQNVRLLVGKMVAEITMPPRSMQSFLYQIQ